MDKGTLGYFNHILSTHLTELEPDIKVLLSSYDETGDGREPMDEVDATASRSAWEDMVRMQHRSRTNPKASVQRGGWASLRFTGVNGWRQRLLIQ